MAEQAAPQRDFEFFVEIIEAFRTSSASANGGGGAHVEVAPFLNAMTMFLRIFDAFSNPFFSDVVKKDVEGNIKKLGMAASKHGTPTLAAVLDAELADAKLATLIKAESGVGCDTGTVALLWMKRTMQFVCGMLATLVAEPATTLSTASRRSYASSLKLCHNFITRGVFDTGLRFAPARDAFYRNLAGGGDVSRVNAALAEFVTVFEPQLDGIVIMYKEKALEPYIK